MCMLGPKRSARSLTASPPLKQLLAALEQASRGVLVLNHEGLLPSQRYAATRAQLAIICLLRALHLGGSTRLVLFTDREWNRVARCLGCMPPPEIWGVGGLERATPDGGYDGPSINSAQAEGLANAFAIARDCGLDPWVEEKAGGLGLYLGGFAQGDIMALGARLWGPWSRLASQYGLQITRMKHGLELRLPGRTREHAIAMLLREISRDTPVAYVGTDVLDEPACALLSGRGLTAFFGPERRRPQPELYLEDWEQMILFLDHWQMSLPLHPSAASSRADFSGMSASPPNVGKHKENFDEATPRPHHPRRSIATRRANRLCSEISTP